MPAMITGLRGTAIFPAMAWLVVAARRREIPLRLRHGVALLLVLAVGSVVRQFRDTGFSTALLSEVSLSPLLGVAEMGASIRPLMLVHSWQDFRHEAVLGFSSYLDPLDRLVRGRVLGLDVVPAEVDPRAMISVMAQRAGQIGGSVIAEANYAAGVVGVVLVLGLLGLVVARLDSLPAAPSINAFVGSVGVILFIWIRNDSTPVAGQLVILAGAFVAVRAVRLLLRRPAQTGQAGVPG
jgi:hypothetical protein